MDFTNRIYSPGYRVFNPTARINKLEMHYYRPEINPMSCLNPPVKPFYGLTLML
jgi:hypothetical protein